MNHPLLSSPIFDDGVPKPIDYIPASSPDRAGPAKAERTKRFTLEIPDMLHRRVKAGCAMQGLVMTDMLRAILESRFPEKP